MCCCAAALPQSTAIRIAVNAENSVPLAIFDIRIFLFT
jgi:hypothetical protein